MKTAIDLNQPLYSQVSQLSKSELDALVDAVNYEYNTRRERQIMESKRNLRVGMEVRVKPKHETGKTRGKTFIINKINPKNLKCTEVGKPYMEWNITATLVEPVE